MLKAEHPSANFAACKMTSVAASLATMTNSTGQLSACVPRYFVPTAQQALFLQDGCQAGELCYVCYDPIANNAPTGACPP